MSWYPGHWQKTFTSRNAAYDYIDFEGLTKLQWELEEGETKLNVFGEVNGDIVSVSVETVYVVEDIRLQFYASIFTENAEDNITTAALTTQYAEYTERFYTTPNSKVILVIE